jgi:hypothetical protein
MGAIIHGGPKQLRQQQMETFNKAVRAMGEAGVNVLCYNFMPHPCRVGRSSYAPPCPWLLLLPPPLGSTQQRPSSIVILQV